MTDETPAPTHLEPLIRSRAAEAPDAPLIEDARSDRVVTRGALAAALDAWKARLDALGAEPGALVVLTVTDPVALATAFLAVVGSGRRAVALDGTIPADALEALTAPLGASLRITDERDDDRPAGRLVLADRLGGPGCTLRSSPTAPAVDLPWDPRVRGASVLFTSGSTGVPKGVELPEAQLLYVAHQVADVLGLGPEDRGFNPLPLFHVNAQVVALTATLVAGGTVVLDARFHRTGFWELLAEKRITWLNAVPTVLAVLARSGPIVPPPSLRLLRSASAPLPAPVRAAFTTVPVVVSWGMTEAASQITSTSIDGAAGGGVGLPRGVEVQARDEAGRVLPAGERGELWIRGRGVVSGYLFGHAADRFDADGWLRTGDVGSAGGDGRVVLAGRLDDVINRGGELVDPAEVEAVLLRDPRVREAVVTGRPDPVLGAVPVAFVIPAGDDDGLEADLAALAARHLPAFKRPSAILTVADVPRTPAGKVVRRRALDLLQAGA